MLTKPGKPAGRGQKIRQTPVFDAATEYDLDLATPNSINDDSGQEWLDQRAPDALVVIAYERLLTKRVLSGRFACNLHASLLPRWRGAAPIHRAVWQEIKTLVFRSSNWRPPWTRERCTPERVFRGIHC